MPPYEALYRRPCRSPIFWTEVGDRSTTGPNLIIDTSEKADLYENVFSWLRAGRRVMLTDGEDPLIRATVG